MSEKLSHALHLDHRPLRGERSTLVDGFAEAIVVEGGRRDGSAETRVTIDLRHPELADDGAQADPSAGAFALLAIGLHARRSRAMSSPLSTMVQTKPQARRLQGRLLRAGGVT